MDTSNQAFYKEATWKEWLRSKFFPAKYCEVPDVQWGEDVLFMITACHLSFIDRLRVLLTGWILVETRTVCENPVGKTITNSVAYAILKRENK